MPLFKMKKVWDYTTYNKPFFIFILFLFCVWVYIDNLTDNSESLKVLLLMVLMDSLLFGYGMTITRDRINEGVRLPKIMFKDVFVLGFKSFSPFGFPPFDLEDLLMDAPETVHLLLSHSFVDTLTFLFIGAVLFYATAFFMEIALARLADTGKLRSAFNLVGIKRNIDTIGWAEYAKDYTMIVIAMAIFSYLTIIVFPFDILNYVWGVFLYMLMFVTQFLGIGAIYSRKRKRKR